MTPALVLAALKQRELARLVSDALKAYHSTILLSRSPLADSALVLPGLIKDNLSPTAEERGQSLKLVLRWSVEQLAPAQPAYPMGVFRPFDDPSWIDPAWWRYNILRHRYIEPLHPDDFVDRGRYTETLMALTGIPSTDTFFAERNRAVAEAADWLQRQEATGESTTVLRQTALDHALQALHELPEAESMLMLAALFDDAIPADLLRELAKTSGIQRPEQGLGQLIRSRYLLAGDDGTLWLSPVLTDPLLRRQEREQLRLHHHRIGVYFQRNDQILAAVHHYRQAHEDRTAAALLLARAAELTQDAELDEIDRVAAAIDAHALAPDQAIELLILRADLNLALGQQEQALSACRSALQRAQKPVELARLYRRMGKIFEQRSQRQALEYYAQAAAHFPDDHPELVEMLKDRGWINIERGEWDAAESDLRQALSLAASLSAFVQANLHDATASLYRYRGDHTQSIEHGRRALALREEAGDILGVAKSQLNLGLLFTAMDEHAGAVSMFQEALATYQKLGNRELAAAALLNIGMAYHFAGDLSDAVNYYEESLELCRGSSWYVTESRAHSNLVEAYAEQGEFQAARVHWEQGVELCRHAGLDSEIDYYGELLERFPALDEAGPAPPKPALRPQSAGDSDGGIAAELDIEQRTAMEIARREGSIAARVLVDACDISKATATRKLVALAELGLLRTFGKGRNVHYRPAADSPQAAVESAAYASTSEQLERQRVLIEQYFSVASLGVLRTGADSELELLVAFDEVPDLQTFFALEQRLGSILRRRVNLTPDFAHQPTGGETAAVHWIWRADAAQER